MMGKIGASLARGLAWAGAVFPALIWNLIGLCGVVGIGYGAWLIYQPAGFIAGGVLLVMGAAMLAPRA